MKSAKILYVLSLIATLSCSSQNTSDLRAINSQIWNNFSIAYNTYDSHLFSNLHHEDFIRISGDSKKIKVKTEYIDGYKQRWEHPDKKQTIDFRFLERFSNGEKASERGIYKLTRNPGEADEKSYYGKFHVVLSIVGDRWLILMDYDSSENDTIDEASYNTAFAKDNYEKY